MRGAGPLTKRHLLPKKRSSAPRYVLTVEPLPGVDGIKALRWTLKSMLRRHGLKCVAVSEGHMGPTQARMDVKSEREFASLKET